MPPLKKGISGYPDIRAGIKDLTESFKYGKNFTSGKEKGICMLF